MIVRVTSSAMSVFICGLALTMTCVSHAVEPQKPASSKAPEVEQARLDVLRALDQVREAEAHLRQAEKKLRELEGKPAPAADAAPAESKVFALRYADAEATAKVLEGAFGKGRVVIAVDPRLNTIIVRGKANDLLDVGALLERLDQEGKPGPAPDDFSVFRLKTADAQGVAAVLTQMYGKGKDSRATIVVEPITNSVLVRARDDDRKMIETLIKYIDAEGTPPQRPAEPQPEVTVIRVEKAEAIDLAQVVSAVFGKGSVHIVPDQATNSLVVRARTDDLKQVLALVRQLDVPPAKPRKGQ
jgi:type II secretory pathway component GspD/PulD (secretin)